MLGRSIRCKIFGDDHQKNNLQLQIIVKRPPAGRRKLMGEKGLMRKSVVDEKEFGPPHCVREERIRARDRGASRTKNYNAFLIQLKLKRKAVLLGRVGPMVYIFRTIEKGILEGGRCLRLERI